MSTTSSSNDFDGLPNEDVEVDLELKSWDSCSICEKTLDGSGSESALSQSDDLEPSPPVVLRAHIVTDDDETATELSYSHRNSSLGPHINLSINLTVRVPRQRMVSSTSTVNNDHGDNLSYASSARLCHNSSTTFNGQAHAGHWSQNTHSSGTNIPNINQPNKHNSSWWEVSVACIFVFILICVGATPFFIYLHRLQIAQDAAAAASLVSA